MKPSTALSTPACVAIWSVVLAMVGCGGGTYPPATGADRAAQLGLPSAMLTDNGDGPALFVSPAASAQPVGFVGTDVTVVPMGPIADGRIPVRIDGSLHVEAYLDARRLTARVQRRGRVVGAPVYVGPNDRVRVLGAAPDGLVHIEAKPFARGLEQQGTAFPTFEGTFPRVGLHATTAPATAVAPREGTLAILPQGQETDVLDAPKGRVISKVPGLTSPLRVVVLREDAGYRGVRIGDGPYLVGYVKSDLTATSPEVGAALAGLAKVDPPVTLSGVPARLRVDGDAPLWRAKAGTRVRFGDKVIGTLNADGYAREMGRPSPGFVDAFVAVDDAVAVRGLVAASDLVPLAGDAAKNPAK